MAYSLNVNFGIPKHGWILVDISYQGFHLDFEASDGLNDPTEELYNIVMALPGDSTKEVTWWNEPCAYYFLFARHMNTITLTISETEDLHDEHSDRRMIQTIIGNRNQIIEPFRKALIRFYAERFKEDHWASNLDKQKMETLIAAS